MEFHVVGNVLEFELEVPEGVDLASIEAKAREEAEAGTFNSLFGIRLL